MEMNEEFDGELYNHVRIGQPRRVFGSFDFSQGRRFSKRLGQRVHVIKMLILMREDSGISQDDRDALKYAIKYIKALEDHIERNESVAPSVAVNVNVSQGGPPLAAILDTVKLKLGAFVDLKKEVA